jgi:hypothetical protein
MASVTRFSVALLSLSLVATPVDAAELTPSSGDWKISARSIKQSDESAKQSVALASGDAVERAVVRTRIKLDTDRLNAEAGVVVHLEDPNVYVLCSIRRGKGCWYAGITRWGPYRQGRLPGDVARLSDESGPGWHTIEVRADGGHVAMIVDEKIRLAASFPLIDGKPLENGNAAKWGPEVFQRRGRVGLATRSAAGQFADFKVEDLPQGEIIRTPLNPEYDANGRVAARFSYDWTMRAFTEWVMISDKLVSSVGGEKDAEPLDDAMAKTGWPPYVFSWATMLDDRGFDHSTQFPSHNGPLTICGFVRYYLYSGDERARDASRIWADWLIDHGSTPPDSPIPHLPLSTYSYFGKAYTKELINVMELDKASFVGIAYLDVHSVTADDRYLAAAKRIAQTLMPYQQSDGMFPFRVDLKTGKVLKDYTCSQLWHLQFFAQLADVTEDAQYRAVSDRALKWLLAGPIRDNKWVGFYGDIKSERESFDQWVALETAQWLIDHHAENPDYLPAVKNILAFVQEKLTLVGGLHKGVPAVVEQTVFPCILPHHNMRLAETYARYHGATGDAEAKELAIRIGNSMTQMVTADGKYRQGLNSGIDELTCLALNFNNQLSRIMAEIPETAPKGENHLLYHCSPVKLIQYRPAAIQYESTAASQDILIVAARPTLVKVDGKTLGELAKPPTSRIQTTPAGWRFEPDSGRLFILHDKGKVEIELGG